MRRAMLLLAPAAVLARIAGAQNNNNSPFPQPPSGSDEELRLPNGRKLANLADPHYQDLRRLDTLASRDTA